MAEASPTVENNVALNAASARYRKSYNKAARNSWREKTENLNLDRDGNKLRKLTKAINDEDTRTKPIIIVENDNILGDREAANRLIDNYEEVSDLTIPEDRKKEVLFADA